MRSLTNFIIIKSEIPGNEVFCFDSVEERKDFIVEITLKLGRQIPTVDINTVSTTQFYPHRFEIAAETRVMIRGLFDKADNIISPPFYAKALRSDERAFFLDFIDGITHSPQQQVKHPLRSGNKKRYTVKADGVHERATKTPQYTQEQKLSYSSPQSTSYILPNIRQKLFGHQTRANRLIGVGIHPKDALVNRMFIYDGGTVNRPYDFDTRSSANSYYQTKKDRVLFSQLSAFTTAIKSNHHQHNEVLARLRWNTDGTSCIFIYSDNLETRLLAQLFARLLWLRLQARASEFSDVTYQQTFGAAWSPEYFPEIYFYTNDGINPNNLSYYHPITQAVDRGKAVACYETRTQAGGVFDNTARCEFIVGLPRNRLYDELMHSSTREKLLETVLRMKQFKHHGLYMLGWMGEQQLQRIKVDASRREKIYQDYQWLKFFLLKKKIQFNTLLLDLLSSDSVIYQKFTSFEQRFQCIFGALHEIYKRYTRNNSEFKLENDEQDHILKNLLSFTEKIKRQHYASLFEMLQSENSELSWQLLRKIIAYCLNEEEKMKTTGLRLLKKALKVCTLTQLNRYILSDAKILNYLQEPANIAPVFVGWHVKKSCRVYLLCLKLWLENITSSAEVIKLHHDHHNIIQAYLNAQSQNPLAAKSTLDIKLIKNHLLQLHSTGKSLTGEAVRYLNSRRFFTQIPFKTRSYNIYLKLSNAVTKQQGVDDLTIEIHKTNKVLEALLSS